MARLKGVGIGAGYFAPFQHEAWARIPEVEIAALANPTEEKARAIMAEFGVPRYYRDWREMLDREQPDFVDIITPPDTHEEICVEAARRGIHIICQKPLAPSLAASQRIVEAAAAAGVRFMVHENWRWQPWYRQVKTIQSAGTIGAFTHAHFLMRLGDGWGAEAYLARQPFFRTYPRLLVYETGVHFLDTLRFLLGEATTVFANLRRLNPAIEGEDAGQIFLRFESGATAIWDANRYNEIEAVAPRFTFGQLRVDGLAGHLSLNTEGVLRVKRLGEPGRDVAYSPDRTRFAGDCVYALQRHFVDCMIGGGEFESNGQDYLKTVRLVEAVYESASKAEVVHL